MNDVPNLNMFRPQRDVDKMIMSRRKREATEDDDHLTESKFMSR